MSRQTKPRSQQNKKNVQQNVQPYDNDSLNMDNLDNDTIRSSEIHETLKKTQGRKKQTKFVDPPAKKYSQPNFGNIKNIKNIIDENHVSLHDTDTFKSSIKSKRNEKPIFAKQDNSEQFSENELDNICDDNDNNDNEDQYIDKDSSDISDFEDGQEISDAFNYDNKKSKSKKVLKENDDDNDDDNNDNDNDDEEMDEEFIQTVVMERVIKYIKLDDVIKEKQNEHKKEMKTLKDTKDQLEQFLIGFLDKINEEYIQLGNKSTLIKAETQTKAAPKMEDISVCLIDGFRKYEIYEDDEEIKRVVKDFIKTIDDKREVKTRKYLKRMNGDADKKENDNNASSGKRSNASVNKSNVKSNANSNSNVKPKTTKGGK